MEKYSLEKAQEEAAQMQEKVESGEADTYDEAEVLSEKENNENVNEEESRQLSIEVQKKAVKLLTEVFKEYNPEKRDSDTGFFGVAYNLNRLLRPESLPENTGSLDGGVAEDITPILENFEARYPHAVQRFRSLFVSESKPENNQHRYDPEKFYYDDKEALEYYKNIIDTNPKEAINFAWAAIDSRHGRKALGMHIVEGIMHRHGWDFIIEDAVGATDEQRHFIGLKECIHKLSTPSNLKTEKIESLFSKTQDDLEWMDLSAYIHNRKKAESLEGTRSNFLVNLLNSHDVPFFDVERTRKEAALLIEEDYEVRQGLLEELRAGFMRLDNYDEGIHTPVINERIKRWENMDADELLHDINPTFAFNVITEYFPDDNYFFTPRILGDGEKGELIESLVLSEQKLREAASPLVAQNDTAYHQALFEVEFHDKSMHSAMLQLDKGDFISPLRWSAHAEGKEEQDEWGYVINSPMLPLAHNTYALFSPTGKILNVFNVEENQKDIDEIRIADFVSMKHILSDESNFSPEENATAAMLIFWDRLPDQWQHNLRQMYNTFDIDIDSFITQCPDSFELAANFSRDLVGLIARSQGFVTALNEYVSNNIENAFSPLDLPEELDINRFLILMNAEYGQTKVTEDEIKDILENLNFDAIRFLQDSLDFDFNAISRREFFSLILYLKTKNDGDGFGALKRFIGQEENRKDKADRIKVFLALEYGADYGDIILKIGEGDPKYAKEIFKHYTELNDKALRIGELLREDEALQGIDVGEDIKGMFPQQIAEAVLRRAKDILNTAEYLTDHDFAEAPYYEGKYIRVSDKKEVAQGLKEYVGILETVERFLTEPQSFEFLSHEDGDVSTFHYKHEKDGENSYFSIQLREYGAPIGEHNPDIEYDGEARINLLFSDKPMTSSLSDPARQDAISLRIDREGKIRDGHKIIGNDPTRKDGEISLEVGSVNHDNHMLPSAVIGRVVSVGNYLGLHRNEKLEHEHPQYYHNRESFSRALGDADVFAEVVRKIKQMLPK